MKDIADKASVSQSTVSLVLNDKPGVSDSVRDKVIKASRELGYLRAAQRADDAVGSLIRLFVYKKNGRIVDDTPFFSDLIEGIQKEARDREFELIVSYYDESTDSREYLYDTMEGKNVSGIILLATEMSEEVASTLPVPECPVIVLDNSFPKNIFDADCVLIDNSQGIYAMTKYLIESGHRDIGYAKGDFRINNFKERHEGYIKALRDAGIIPEDQKEFFVGTNPEDAYRGMLRYLGSGRSLDMPTAIVSENDFIAIGVARALTNNGYRIPQDISVTGFDNIVTSMMEPKLTTIHVYKNAMGRTAVRQLVQKIEDKKEGVENFSVILRMKTDIIINESVGRIVLKESDIA